MNLAAVGSAFPSNSFTQQECLDAMKAADFWQGLKGRSQMVIEKVLSGDSGIQKRHFALDSLEQAWSRGAQELNEAYEKEAPDLAVSAIQNAIAKSGHRLDEVDAVFVSSLVDYCL